MEEKLSDGLIEYHPNPPKYFEDDIVKRAFRVIGKDSLFSRAAPNEFLITVSDRLLEKVCGYNFPDENILRKNALELARAQYPDCLAFAYQNGEKKILREETRNHLDDLSYCLERDSSELGPKTKGTLSALITEVQKNAIEIMSDPNRKQQTYREARQIAIEIMRQHKKGINDLRLYRMLPEGDLKRLIDSMRTRDEARKRIENHKLKTLYPVYQISLEDLLEPVDPDGLMESNC